jgi:hypothetical protein
MADGIAKFGVIRAVPGINGIESCEVVQARCFARAFGDADEIEAGVGDGSGAVGELDEREDGARGPEFGVVSARGFELGQRENAIADCAGTNEETPHNNKFEMSRRLTPMHADTIIILLCVDLPEMEGELKAPLP